MSVELSTVILAHQVGLLGIGEHGTIGYSPAEDSSIVATTPEEVYPGEFGNADVFIMSRGTGNPVDPHGGIPGIRAGSLQETFPDYDPNNNESGLVGNWPQWYGDAGIGLTPMTGATVRVRRPAESGAGPVGTQDEMANLQYAMYQTVVDFATEQASQASLATYA